ncbi:Subtilisin-like protease [Venturia nashicola]|uniref:Subtilisin-like protease n=1 Tax=Venturia nashicola TaxID=86259 RepID=A0A4Z1NQL2_9PEZI|nr:Subtilisin-like protease [Venturia nashicola]
MNARSEGLHLQCTGEKVSNGSSSDEDGRTVHPKGLHPRQIWVPRGRFDVVRITLCEGWGVTPVRFFVVTASMAPGAAYFVRDDFTKVNFLSRPTDLRQDCHFLSSCFFRVAAICTYGRGTIVSTTDSLKLENVDPDSYLVMLKPPQNALENIVDTLVDEVIAALNLNPKRKYKNGRVKGFSAILSSSQLKSLKSNPKVAYIESDATLKIQVIIPPQDTPSPIPKRALLSQSPAPWNLARLSHRSKGQTTYIYDSSATGQGTCNYILDTGLYTQHNDFQTRATLLKNFDLSDNSDKDLSGHGTHVAAILAGTTHGIAKSATIYAIKVCNKSGSCNLSDVIAGIALVISDSKTRLSTTCANGVTMTLSFGAPMSTWRSMQESIQAATQAGIFVVAAAGNDNVDVKGTTPASSPFVCSVGASDINDTKASFSNHGATIAIFAPGVNIKSAWIGNIDASNILSGTSMSAPHIAGLAASIMSSQGPQSPLSLCNRIKTNANINVLSGLPGGTPNRLAYNGAAA